MNHYYGYIHLDGIVFDMAIKHLSMTTWMHRTLRTAQEIGKYIAGESNRVGERMHAIADSVYHYINWLGMPFEVTTLLGRHSNAIATVIGVKIALEHGSRVELPINILSLADPVRNLCIITVAANLMHGEVIDITRVYTPTSSIKAIYKNAAWLALLLGTELDDKTSAQITAMASAISTRK